MDGKAEGGGGREGALSPGLHSWRALRRVTAAAGGAVPLLPEIGRQRRNPPRRPPDLTKPKCEANPREENTPRECAARKHDTTD